MPQILRINVQGGICFDFQDSQGSASATWQRHIVRVREYQPLAQLHSHLTEYLISYDGWKFADRANPAQKFPTDFAVVTVSSCFTHVILEALQNLATVKDVTPDRQLRSLQSEREGISKESQHEDGVKVGKPSGRLRTRWSLEGSQLAESEANELKTSAAVLQARRSAHQTAHRAVPILDKDSTAPQLGLGDSNDSNSKEKANRHLMPWGSLADIDLDDAEAWTAEAQRRQLLGSGTQVSDAMGAPKLWSQGYKGKNVRVGMCLLLLSELCTT